jgi:hypothetical protein
MIPILYNIPHCQTPRDNNGKSNQCASAASCGAARSAVARREVRPSDFRDRVAKWFRNIPERKPTNPSYFGSFAAENGAGAKSEMGKDSESIAASSGRSKKSGLHSSEAHDLGSRPQEDRGCAKSEVGDNPSGEEESGVDLWSLLRVRGRLLSLLRITAAWISNERGNIYLVQQHCRTVCFLRQTRSAKPRKRTDSLLPSSGTSRGDVSELRTHCLVFDAEQAPRLALSSCRIGCIARDCGDENTRPKELRVESFSAR